MSKPLLELPPTDLPSYSCVEFAALLRVHPNSVYRRVTSGEIPVLRFGRTIRIPGGYVREALGVDQ